MVISSPRSAERAPANVPLDWSDTPQHLRLIVSALRELQARALGHGMIAGSVTLGQSVTTTQVSDNRIKSGATVHLTPTTANAASIDSQDLYVSAVAAGSFTLTHDSNTATDRTFYYLAINPVT